MLPASAKGKTLQKEKAAEAGSNANIVNLLQHSQQFNYASKHKGLVNRYELTQSSKRKHLKCEPRDFTTPQRQTLTRHQGTHLDSDSPLFRCPLCPKQYRTKRCLSVHHKIIHQERKPSKSYKCSYCDYACAIRAVVTQHERKHTGEKPFTCFFCNKTFAWGFALENHIRTHTGEKPFKCSVCKREFATEKALYHHKVTHEDTTPFKCEYCEKGFKLKSSLKRHQVSHGIGDQVRCDKCEQTFTAKSTLVCHIRYKHSDERPFSCTICPSTFKKNSDLSRHKKKHLNASQNIIVAGE